MEFGEALTRKRQAPRKCLRQMPLNRGVTSQAASHHAWFRSRPVAVSAFQAMDTQLNALPILAVLARTVSGCLNSAFLDISQHFTGHLFSPWIPSSARDIDGGTPTLPQSLAIPDWGQLSVRGGRISPLLMLPPS